ncbi:hypothetical protein [Musicola keenii]|uniref:hypothetical protein n=1 Tax=Musicola keenii TaxID=2884250 RepID=UPI0017856D87|nr:hypothetical protein [Musicola keenii]
MMPPSWARRRPVQVSGVAGCDIANARTLRIGAGRHPAGLRDASQVCRLPASLTQQRVYTNMTSLSGRYPDGWGDTVTVSQTQQQHGGAGSDQPSARRW